MPRGHALVWDENLLVELAERDNVTSLRQLAVQYGLATGQVISPSNISNYTNRVGGDLQGTLTALLPGAPTKATTGASRKSRAMRDGVRIEGDTATVVTPPDVDLSSIDDALRARGMDPDLWETERVTVNEWQAMSSDGELLTLRQLKIVLRRRVTIQQILQPCDVKPRSVRKAKPRGGAGHLVVLLPDLHAPYTCPALEEKLLAFLADVAPPECGLLGDVLDLARPSTHKVNRAYNETVNEGLAAAFASLRAYTEAAPTETKWWQLLGNHDIRIEAHLQAMAPTLAAISPPALGDEPEVHALSLRRLLHLDRLGIELVEPKREGDNWQQAYREITPNFEARHGWVAGAKSAEKMLAKVNRNFVCGHTHRQTIVRRTTWLGDQHTTIDACEAGTLRVIEGGGGFAVNPDWQMGFAVGEIDAETSTVSLDLARWSGGKIHWRGMSW